MNICEHVQRWVSRGKTKNKRSFPATGYRIGERQRGQAPFQDPEHQRQHHSHGDGGPLSAAR